jgi:glucosamine kinase
MPALNNALAQAGLDRAALAHGLVGVGLAGINGDDEAQALAAASPAAFVDIAIASLAHTACLGAFAGRDGAILMAGDTDNIGYALLGGVAHQIGGWDFPLADDASAAALGRSVVHAVLRSVDGLAAHNDLSRQVLASHSNDPARFLAWLRTAGPADYASLAPPVLEMAMAGDSVAIALVSQTAEILTAQIRRLTELGVNSICLMGTLGDALRDWLPPPERARLKPAQGDTVDGAIFLISQNNVRESSFSGFR